MLRVRPWMKHRAHWTHRPSLARTLAAGAALLVLLAVLLPRTQGVSADATCSVPPVNLTSAVSEDGSAVVLSWEVPPDCTPDEYAVYRRDMDVEGARMAKIDTVDGDVLTYTDSTVTAGQHYRYRIRSNDLGSRSGRTDITLPEATATEPTPEPTPEPGSEPSGQDGGAQPRSVPRNEVTLVGNFNQTAGTNSNTIQAQGFTTGSNTPGYGLTSVQLDLTGTGSSTTLAVKIFTTNSDGSPNTEHATLTNPDSIGNGTQTFTAPDGTTLMPGTTYTVVVSAASGGTIDGSLRRVTGTGEDSGGADGWTIADKRFHKAMASDNWTEDTGLFLKIRVKGTITSSDSTAPSLDTATVDGTSLVLTYDETLDEDSTPLASAYSVTVAGTSAAPSSVSISGMAVTLTLASTVIAGETVTVSYTVPTGTGATPVQDEAGNDAAALSNESVTNNTVNNEPEFDSGLSTMRTLSENSAAGTNVGMPFTATDDDGDTLTYTLSGADASSFQIVATSGQIQAKSGVDYDFESAKKTYTVTVNVRDNKDQSGNADTAVDDSITVTINLTNVEEVGSVTITGDLAVGETLTATVSDPDGNIGSVSWQWARGATATGSFDDISGATNATYTVVPADVGMYLRASVVYGDTLQGNRMANQVTSQILNTAPTFDDGASVTFMLDENAGAGVNIGDPVPATDLDGDTLVYSMAGADSPSFTFNTATQQFSTKSGVTYDYESKSGYSVTLRVHDGKNAANQSDTTLDDSITVIINLRNLDEPGTVTITGTESGGEELTGSVTDLDGTPTSVSWQWALGASASGPFAPISGATSSTYTTVAADVNRFLQATASYTDPQGSGKSASAVTGQISAGNSEPTFDDSDPATREVAENSGANVNVGSAVAASDGDSDTLTYSFGTGGDESSFNLNTGTGQITTKNGITYNYEGTATYSVTVRVGDSKDAAGNANTNIDDTISVIISLTDVNERPTISTTQTAVSVAENQTSVLDYDADDEDTNGETNDAANTLTWSVESADDGAFFEIGSSSGVLTFKSAPNFEDRQDADTDGVYNVTVTVTDNGIDGARGASNHLSVSKSLAVRVTDVNETPTLTTAPATVSFDENATGVVATYIATDPDATTGTMSWDLSGNDAGDFTITSTVNGTAELTFKSPPDYESPDDTGTDNTYDLTVRVRDNASPRLEDTQIVQVMVNDLNETPVVSGNGAPSFQEIDFSRVPGDIPASDYEVATFTAYDDDSDTVSWSVAGTDAAHFSINSSTGVLSFDIAAVTHPVTGDLTARPDFERPDDMDGNNQYVIQVRADDQQGESNSVGTFEVTVTVTALNEIPVLTSGDLNPTFAEIPYDAASWDSLIGEYRGHDEEGQDIFYETLAGPDTGDIEGSSVTTIGDRFGRLRFKQRPNFEDPADSPESGQTEGDNVYKVTMRLRDTAGITTRIRPYPIAVTVTNIDETPEITDLPNALYDEIEYDAGVALADIADVAVFTARDEEGEEITWLLDGADASDFTITKNADGQGVLRFAQLPDFEQSTGSGSTSNVYELIILARDANTPPDNTAENVGQLGQLGDEFLVQVDDVNEQPEFTGSPSAALTHDEHDATLDASFQEPPYAFPVIASYTARDEEGFVDWSLEGPDRLDFEIDSGGSVVFRGTPNFEDPDDANGDNVYQYTVVATDRLSGTTRRAARHDVTLTVQDVEEDGAISVSNLNPAVGESVTFTISDPDGGIVLTQVPGEGGFAWVIQTRTSGGGWQQLIHSNTGLGSYTYVADEDETGLEIRAIVSSYTDRRGGGKSAESEATAAITPDPIPNAPPRIRTGSAQNIPETGAGEEVGERVTATDRDNDTLTFAIGEGGDGALFEIHPTTGQLRTAQPLDFETTTGLLLVPVNVSDGRDDQGTVETERVVDASTTVSIRVLDVEEEGAVTLSEPEPGVGVTVQATLTDGDGSISGRSWRWWRSINGRTGWTAIPNTTSSATSTSYTTVLADAGFFLRASVTYTDNRGGGKRAEGITALRVFGENQQPTFPAAEDGARTVPENSPAGTNIGDPVAAEDPENDRLTYSLSGTDAAAFSIVPGSGQLRVKEPLDFETRSSYRVTVDVHDGKDGLGNASAAVDDSVDVTITVGNEDEPGSVTLTTLTASIQARVEVTAVLEDDDGPSPGSVSWAWHRSPNGRTDWVTLAGATGARYTPTLVDAGNFLRATASYNDGHGQDKTASEVSPRVGDPPPVNSAPAFPATEDGRRDVPEDARGGDAVGDPVEANDLNAGDSAVNDPLAYSLTGTDAGSFTIDEGSGQIRLAQGTTLDFEGKRTYRVTVEVTDGRDQNGDDDMDAIDASRTVTISVTDVNEAPVVSGDTTPSVAENTSAAVATYTGADPERDTLEWSVNNTDFWISSRGQLYFQAPPDYEGGSTSFSIRVTATDPEGLEGHLDVTVTVTDVEEAGVLTLSPPRGWQGTRFDAVLDDDDGNVRGETWMWERSTNRSSWEEIAGATSSSYTAGADDVGSYLRVSVEYSDQRGGNKTASAQVAARIGDTPPTTNTDPTFDEAEVPRSVGQGTRAGRSVGAPVKAEDPDPDDVLTYTLSGPDADNFEIDPETGQIRTKAVLDPDVKETHNVTVDVHDGFDGSYTRSESTDDSVDVIITVARSSTPSSGVGGFVGGGPGGGPSGPTASDVDFEWNVERDIEPLDPGNDWPTGMWSDGATLWLLDNAPGAGDAVYAYDLQTGERLEEREFALDGSNRAPRGIWSDGETMWVSDSGQETLFAYDLETGGRLPERDIELARRNRDARGIWSGGETIWVLNRNPSLFAYELETGTFIAQYALHDANGDPRGAWSDGVTLWVSDHGAKRLFAYRLPELPEGEPPDEPPALERVQGEEFLQPGRAGNNSPRGIWSDATVMYVADENDDRVYSYNMADAWDARLASLELSGVDIGEFDPARTEYAGVAAPGATEATVAAQPAQDGASVEIDPADADEEAEGHQVALDGLREVTVTVTSPDGSRERAYRVLLGESGAEASCLQGDVAVGFSLLIFAGGSVEELVSCAESRRVTALYATARGAWIPYIAGAPSFVNRSFTELFAGGIASGTPLLARSEEGHAGRAPAQAPEAPTGSCLSGEIAPGFSIVLYAGGSLGELEACAESLGVGALYALDEGSWVPYILGAPSFVNRSFSGLFPGGLPHTVPLVVRSDGPSGAGAGRN